MCVCVRTQRRTLTGPDHRQAHNAPHNRNAQVGGGQAWTVDSDLCARINKNNKNRQLRAVPVWSRANAVFSCLFGVASYSRAFCTLFRDPLHGRFLSLRAPTQPWRHCIQTLTKGYSLPNSVVS